MALRLFSDQVQRQPVVRNAHRKREGMARNICSRCDDASLYITDIVAQIANTTGIPHIEYDLKLEATRQEHLNHQMSVNVAPSLSVLSRAYFEIIKTNYEWRTFTLIYETPEGK